MSRMAKLRQINHQTSGVTTLLAVYESHIEKPCVFMAYNLYCIRTKCRFVTTQTNLRKGIMRIMEYSFSRKVSLVIQYSKEEAEKLHNPCISPEHLVLGMIKDKDNKAVYALESLYVDIYQVQQTLSELLHDKAEETQARVFGVVFDEAGTNALKGSVWESIRLNSSEINVEHLLLAIMRQKENKVTQIINSYDVTYQDIADKLKEANQPKPSAGFDFDEEDDDEGIQRQPLFNSGSEKKEAVGQKETNDTKEETPFLDQYGTDLTKLAAEDKLDSVIGRKRDRPHLPDSESTQKEQPYSCRRSGSWKDRHRRRSRHQNQ